MWTSFVRIYKYFAGTSHQPRSISSAVSRLLGITSVDPDPLMLALIPPLDENELYEYRLPNVCYPQSLKDV